MGQVMFLHGPSIRDASIVKQAYRSDQRCQPLLMKHVWFFFLCFDIMNHQHALHYYKCLYPPESNLPLTTSEHWNERRSRQPPILTFGNLHWTALVAS